MVDEIDIWRAAEQMRKLYGTDAAILAAMRADTLMDQGDVEGFNMRSRVVAALNKLDRAKPRNDEAGH